VTENFIQLDGMAEQTKILLVDDEPGIRTTLPAVLTGFGFSITAAATVPEALQLVATQQFDILIADLNIGQPGDGFTVVSAMRRTQPKAITFILTGYPAFETALEAIRQQVDDYLIKPTDIEMLVEKIRRKLANPKASAHHIEARRLAEILDRNKREIVQRWLHAAKQDPLITSVKLSDHELTEQLTSVFEEVISGASGQPLSEGGLRIAGDHGRARFEQGCTISAVMREGRILQRVLSHFIQENLLGTDISSLIPDVMRVGETVQAYFEASIREFVHARHSAKEATVQTKGKLLLLLSADRELALLREHALRQAGYSVTAADSRKEALRFLKQSFDLLVISYSMLSKNITEMTELFREQNPHSPIVTVTKGKWQRVKLDADHAVSGEEGPAALIEAVEAALNRKQLRRIK